MRPIDADVAIKNLKEWLNQTGIIPKDTSYYWELLGCIEDTPVVEFPPVVRCKDCCYWKDRKVGLLDGTERDYKPDEPQLVTLSVGTNIGSHCTLHGFENESGSWFWSNANDFCSRGRRNGDSHD